MRPLLTRIVAIGAAALVAAAAPPADPSTAAWVRSHAVAMGDAGTGLSRDEAATLARIVDGARVIGLGEPFHGHEEPLAHRNRLIRHLVAHQGLTAVALETGIAETKRVGDYVLGGPGDARALVLDNLSWRFNDLVANLDLVVWLRAWNDAHPARRVTLYGIDVSGGDAKAEFGRSRVSIDTLIAYLARAAPEESQELRSRLASFSGRFSNAGYAAMTVAERGQLRDTLRELGALLVTRRKVLIRASSADDVAWASRIAQDAADAERIFAVWPSDPATPMPGAAMVAEIRDRAMAANTLWALDREGRRGRILLFASNTHVGAAPMRALSRKDHGGTTVGQELRKALGTRYRVIVTASSLGRSADDAAIGSVDRALVAAGRPRALLDIRQAPGWWDSPQTLAHGGARVNAVTPRRAFDGIVYVDRLTPAKLFAMESR